MIVGEREPQRMPVCVGEFLLPHSLGAPFAQIGFAGHVAPSISSVNCSASNSIAARFLTACR